MSSHAEKETRMQGYVHGLCRGGEVSFRFGFLNFEKAGLSCLPPASKFWNSASLQVTLM